MDASDTLKRACRLFFAVGLVVVIGVAMFYATGASMEDPICKQVRLATAGAGITCVVAQAPLIGNLARAGVENTVGTILGGSLGFAVFKLGHAIALAMDVPQERELATEYLIRLAFAPFVGTLGVFFGRAVGMDISGKLLLLTWLLVCVNNDEVGQAGLYAITRSSAIIIGVICSEIAMLVVFPASATSEALAQVKKALRELLALNRAIWADVSSACDPRSLEANDRSREPLLEAGGAIDRANYYGTVNEALNMAAVHMESAQYEAVFRCTGSSRCTLPTCYCLPKGWSLPVPGLLQVSESVRKMGRIAYCLNQLSRGPDLRAVLPNTPAMDLVKTLADTSQAAIHDIFQAFPRSLLVPSSNLQKLVAATKELDQMPVPQSLSQPPEEPSPGASLLRRDSVLARLPSLQGKGFTPEMVVFSSFQWFVGELAQELSQLHSAMNGVLAHLHA